VELDAGTPARHHAAIAQSGIQKASRQLIAKEMTA